MHALPAARPGRGAQAQPHPPGCRPRRQVPAAPRSSEAARPPCPARATSTSQSADAHDFLLPPIPTPATITLVRHGQSTWNAAGIIQGSSNVSVLTDKGKAQAAATRDALAGGAFDALVHSPLARAAETAAIIWAGVRAAHPRCGAARASADARLREIDLHSFEGLNKAHGAAKAGPAYAAWQADPAAFQLDGTFPVRDLWARAAEAWGGVLVPAVVGAGEASGLAAPSLLVVAHNAVNQALLCTALGLPPSAFRRLAQANGAVTEVALEKGEGGGGGSARHHTVASVRRMNDRGPLAGPDLRPPKIGGRCLVALLAVEDGGGGGSGGVSAALAAAGPWAVVAARGCCDVARLGVEVDGLPATCEPADLWRAAVAAASGTAPVLAAGPPAVVEAALAAAAGLDAGARATAALPPFFAAPPGSLAGVEVGSGGGGGPAASVRFTGWRG